MKNTTDNVMITFAIDLILLSLMGIGNMECVNLAIIVVKAIAINWATRTFLRQYLLHYKDWLWPVNMFYVIDFSYGTSNLNVKKWHMELSGGICSAILHYV